MPPAIDGPATPRFAPVALRGNLAPADLAAAPSIPKTISSCSISFAASSRKTSV